MNRIPLKIKKEEDHKKSSKRYSMNSVMFNDILGRQFSSESVEVGLQSDNDILSVHYLGKAKKKEQKN